MIMPWVVVVFAFVGFMGAFFVSDLVKKAQLTPRVPSRSLGNGPQKVQHLNAIGERQLRTAIIVVTQMLVEPGRLQVTTAKQLSMWLDECGNDAIDKVTQLDNAGRILTVAETEHNMLTGENIVVDAALDPSTASLLKDWLDDYYQRR